MNNLPLQPLKWGYYQGATDFKEYAKGANYTYLIILYRDKYTVSYYKPNDIAQDEKGFATIDDAKTWAWNHYNEKMQPYVKPAPTWIDVNERLPERKELLTDKDKCLVLTECGKVWTGFYNIHIKPDDWYLHGWTEKQGWHPFKIVAWMLASEFSTMQNLHKGE